MSLCIHKIQCWLSSIWTEVKKKNLPKFKHRNKDDKKWQRSVGPACKLQFRPWRGTFISNAFSVIVFLGFFFVHRLIGRHSFGSFHVCMLAQTSSSRRPTAALTRWDTAVTHLTKGVSGRTTPPVFPFLVLALKTPPGEVPAASGASVSSGRGRDGADAGIKVGSALCVSPQRPCTMGRRSVCVFERVRACPCACIRERLKQWGNGGRPNLTMRPFTERHSSEPREELRLCRRVRGFCGSVHVCINTRTRSGARTSQKRTLEWRCPAGGWIKKRKRVEVHPMLLLREEMAEFNTTTQELRQDKTLSGRCKAALVSVNSRPEGR